MKPCPTCWGTGKIPNHAALGKRARRVRQNRGLSLKEMALRLGVTDSYLSYLETGKRRWSREMFQKVTNGANP